MKYDNIPHLYCVWNVETGEAWELFAKDNIDKGGETIEKAGKSEEVAARSLAWQLC